MKLSQFIHTNLIVATLFSFCANSFALNEPVEEMLKDARKQFYAAIEDKKQIDPAIKRFEQIAQVSAEIRWKNAGLHRRACCA